MKKILFIFLIPVFSFTQSGDTNGDGFVNLEDLFNVLENWLEEVNANDTESISNIEEMINVVDSLITINQNFDISKNTYFPEGLSSQIINHNLAQGEYIVPEGKRLYVLNVQSDAGLFIDGLEIMYNVQSGQGKTLGLPIIINSNQSFSAFTPGNTSASFNGFLVDESGNLEGVTIIVEPNTYTVPDNKILFINHYYAGSLSIDNNAVWGLNYLSGSNYPLRIPTMIGAGQEVSCVTFGNDDTDCVINGYLVDEDYFSNASSSSAQSSTEQSLSTPIFIDDSEYGNSWECDYVNTFPIGAIIHNVLIGESAIVVPGPACGSDMLYPVLVTENFQNVPKKDFLWCFTVNDTIAITNLPLVGSNSSALYYLEDYTEGYDPNSDTSIYSNNFTVDGQITERLLYKTINNLIGNDVVLIPGKIYGWELVYTGTDFNIYICDFEIVDSNIFNNYGLWKQNDEIWETTDQFPCIPNSENSSNFHYYPFGKKLKAF